VIFNIPMIESGKRTMKAIEDRLPVEIKQAASVTGKLTIDYVTDQVLFELSPAAPKRETTLAGIPPSERVKEANA
jgi:hypothetical protein